MKKPSPIRKRTLMLMKFTEKNLSPTTQQKISKMFKNILEEERETKATEIMVLMETMSEKELLNSLRL